MTSIVTDMRLESVVRRVERRASLGGDFERVAVKRVNPMGGVLDRHFVQQEAAVLKKLSDRPYITPFYGLHLPPMNQGKDPAYIIMG